MHFSLEGEAFTQIIWNSFFDYYFIYWHVCAHTHAYMRACQAHVCRSDDRTFQSQFCTLGPGDETQVVRLSSKHLGLQVISWAMEFFYRLKYLIYHLFTALWTRRCLFHIVDSCPSLCDLVYHSDCPALAFGCFSRGLLCPSRHSHINAEFAIVCSFFSACRSFDNNKVLRSRLVCSHCSPGVSDGSGAPCLLPQVWTLVPSP